MAEKLELEGTVKSKTEAQSANGTYFRIGIQEPGQDRPFDWSFFDKKKAQELEIGKTYRLMVSRPENPNGQHAYRNLEEVLGEVEPGSNGAAAAQSGEVQKRPYELADHRSVERQTALKVAAELLQGTQAGKSPEDLVGRALSMAESLYAWLSGPASVGAKSVDDAFDDLGKSPGELSFDGFWQWVTKDRKKSRQDVETVLGTSLGRWLQEEGGTMERAREVLGKAWGS